MKSSFKIIERFDVFTHLFNPFMQCPEGTAIVGVDRILDFISEILRRVAGENRSKHNL